MTDLDQLDALAAAAEKFPTGYRRMHAILEFQKNCDPATIRSLVAAVRERDELRAARLHPDDGYSYDGCEGPHCRAIRDYAIGTATSPESVSRALRAALHREDGT